MRHGGYRSSDLMYQGKHHTDVVFQGKFLEKLFMESDDCDGIIWEKNHRTNNAIICMTSWYPGFYGSTNFQGTRLYLQDPKMPYVTPNPIGGEAYMRTKDFIISQVGTYWSAPTGSYAVSKDGKEWTKRIGGAPAKWESQTFGWSTKENVGMLPYSGKIYRFDIDDDGKLTWTDIAEDLGSGAAIGDIIQQGIVQDGTHRWYRFINPEGELYTSRLPDHYTYDFEDWWGAHSVVDGTYSWSFYYINGKYIAFTTSKINHVKAYSTSNYEYWYDVLFVESDDGFKTIRSKYFESPKLAYSFQSVVFFYFENKYLMYEGGETIDGNVRTPYLWVWDFGNSYFNTPRKIVVPQTYTVPMVGMNSDPNVDSVTVVMYGSVPAQNRNYVKGYGGFTNAVYIKDGKISEPYGGIIIPTAFRPNGWSSNSYDEGGWIYLDGGLLRAPKRGIAYGGYNYMVDRDNATWGIDKYRLTICGPANADVTAVELDSAYKPFIHGMQLSEAGRYDRYVKFHQNKLINVTLLGETPIIKKRSLRRGGTVIDFRDPGYNTVSEYYFDDTGVFTTIIGNDYSKLASGPVYCFAVHYYWLQYGRYLSNAIGPLIISTDEFRSMYNSETAYQNVNTLEYAGFTWYYETGVTASSDDKSAERYLDLSDYPDTPSALGSPVPLTKEMVLECLKRVHTIN